MRALRPIHDLEALLDDAVAAQPELEDFRDFCIDTSDFHLTHRYPGIGIGVVEAEELERLVGEAERLLEAVEAAARRPR